MSTEPNADGHPPEPEPASEPEPTSESEPTSELEPASELELAVAHGERPALAPAAPPPPPTVAAIVRAALDGLLASAAELRVLSVAVVIFGTVAVGLPLGAAFLYFGSFAEAPFVAGSPGVPPASLPPYVAELALPALIALVVGTVAFFILFVQVPLYIVASIGGRLAGEPLTLRQSLRRARQVFLRGVGAAFLIGLAAGIPTLIAQSLIGALLGATELATGLSYLAGAIFSSPWVYVLPGIVLGGVATAEAMRRSWRLARYRWRLALTIALLAVVGQVIVLVAASSAFDVVLTVGLVGGLAGFGFEVPAAAEPIVGGAFLVAALAFLVSLVFGTQLVQFAPAATGFYALTRYAAGLDAARSVPPEPLFRWPALLFYGAGVLSAIVILVVLLSQPPG